MLRPGTVVLLASPPSNTTDYNARDKTHLQIAIKFFVYPPSPLNDAALVFAELIPMAICEGAPSGRPSLPLIVTTWGVGQNIHVLTGPNRTKVGQGYQRTSWAQSNV